MILLASATAMIAVALLVFFYGPTRARGRSNDLRSRLRASQHPTNGAAYHPSLLVGLPSPVQRYFSAVLADGQPMITAMTWTQEGSMQMKPTDSRWRPFKATQLFVTDPPGFEWNARLRMMPGVDAHVSDAYVQGRGELNASLFGLFPVGKAEGTPEIARGELLRYLAEAVWFPTALLPGHGLRWAPIDDRTARATLEDGSTTVSIDFGFGDDGLIETAFAHARDREVDGRSEPLPWKGRFTNYSWRHGIQTPLNAEVSWEYPEGPWVYWRGRIVDIEYEF